MEKFPKKSQSNPISINKVTLYKLPIITLLLDISIAN